MDKRVILAVAGSGKTSLLVSSLDESRRFLIVTYTESNYDTIRLKIIQRFGYFPANITLFTYFSFLYGFCYRPFLRSEKNTKGIIFNSPPSFPKYKLTDDRRYMTPSRWLYANRLAKFIEISNLTDAVVSRIEKYFDAILVDEVQDFAGHDFNFLLELSQAGITVSFVGDFYQHTFDTSRDEGVNKNLYIDYKDYVARFVSAGLNVDTTSLMKSRRCSRSVCEFITDKIGISIVAHDDRDSIVTYEDDPEVIIRLFNEPATVKLFYKEHYRYPCYSQNWGASKGIDQYQDVCVVLNQGSVKAWNSGGFRGINSTTRNKLYVACSRAKGNLTLIPEVLLSQYKQ